MKKKTENLLIFIILIVGFVLRFFSAISHSYSSDELSAIIRLRHDSFNNLIEYGVKVGDMHPAGVQIFMKFWSLLFGTSELAMRLPFVLLGTASIWLIYKIGKYYSNETALFSAAIWAVLLFPIIQSELARPYSPGLFFVLLSILFILKILFSQIENKQVWLTSLGLSFSIAGCMYTHYFAFLTVGFIAISSMIWIKKKVLLPYILAGIFASILFLPHVSITLYQTGIEGGIQWLAPPENWWLLKFLFFVFNSSWLVVTGISVLILVGLALSLKEKIYLSKLTILFFIWFIGTYLVGHLISYSFTPILKYPVMIFALPAFILVLAKIIKPAIQIFKGFLVFAFIAITLLSTTLERKLFSPVHYEVLKELSVHIRDWEAEYDEENILKILNISDPEYLNFYGRQSGDPHQLDLDIINYNDAKLLDSLLSSSSKPYLIIGYSGRDTPIQFLNQSLKYFPHFVKVRQYNNSAVVMLSKNLQTENNFLQPIKTISLGEFDYKWDFEMTNFNSSSKQYIADSSNIYSPQLLLPIDDKTINNSHFVRVKIKAKINDLNQVSIVAQPENKIGEPIKDSNGTPIYMGLDVESDLQKFGEASFAFSLPKDLPRKSRLKIYIWNRNKVTFLIEQLKIEIIKNIWNN